MQKDVLNALRYDSRFLGRGLIHDIPALGLLANDRLEPCLELNDIATFEVQTPPFVCRFWRMDLRHDRLLHATPIFENIPGLSVKSIAIDLLHTWHLGGMADYIAFVFWFLIKSRVYTSIAHLSKDDDYKVALLKLKAEMWAYYKQRDKDDFDFRTKGSRVSPPHVGCLLCAACSCCHDTVHCRWCSRYACSCCCHSCWHCEPLRMCCFLPSAACLLCAICCLRGYS